MHSKTLLLCASFVVSTLTAAAGSPAETSRLSLETAIRQTLMYSPKLKAGMEGIGASRGDRLQSGLVPNPEFSTEAENILGSGSTQGFGAAEVTLGIAQPIELGGKRTARIKAADYQADIATLQYQSVALDLVRDTEAAWTKAVAAYEEVKLTKNQEELAADMLQSVASRVNAAVDPAIQQSKAEVALASSRIARQKAERDLETAMKNLSRLWGEETSDIMLDTGSFFTIQKPDLGNTPYHRHALEKNPDVKLLEAGVSLADAHLDIERSNAIPDVTVGVGIRDSRAAGSQSFVVGVSIPFPVFNRNQGAILKAGHERVKAEHEKAASLQAINLELLRAGNTLETSWLEVESLEKDILPTAEKAFSQARQGYKAGKFPYLEVLDAQRTLAAVQMQRIAALKEYHTAKTDFDRLTGKNIDLLNAYGDQK